MMTIDDGDDDDNDDDDENDDGCGGDCGDDGDSAAPIPQRQRLNCFTSVASEIRSLGSWRRRWRRAALS